MEAAGTVVGVVALGITLCDGIIQYCQAWKNQDEDVRDLSELANGLKTVLQDVETWLQQRQGDVDLNVVPSLPHSLKACNDHISKAIDISDKYSKAPASTKGKLKDILQRLKFPFKRHIVPELRDIIIAFRGNVNTALQLLDIDLTVVGIEATRKLQIENRDEHQTIISEIRNASTHITSSVTHGQSQELSTQTNTLETMIRERTESSRLSIERRISGTSATVISEIQAASTEARMLNKELQTYLETFALKQAVEMQNSVRQIQDLVATASEPFPSLTGAISTSRKNKRNRFARALTDIPDCTCGATEVIAKANPMLNLYWRNCSFYKESDISIIHDRRCPLWYISRKVTKYRFRARLFGRDISGSLDLRIPPYAPISGCKILPSLHIRPVVPSNSGSFRVVNRYIGDSSFQLEHVPALIRDLSLVFQSGHGSPWDMDEVGWGIIKVITDALPRTNLEVVWRLVKEFVAMGVNISDVNESDRFIINITGYSFHSTIMSAGGRAQLQSFLLWLVERGVNMEGHNLEMYTPSRFACENYVHFINALRAHEDLAEASDCGILSTAVLRRNLLQVQDILKRKPYLLEKERNLFGQSPVFLGVGWPEGLKILLAAENRTILEDNCAPYGPITPLDYAITLGCVESMTLLASKGLGFHFSWCFQVFGEGVSHAVSKELLRLIIERFHQLHEFARAVLPSKLILAAQLDDFEFFVCKLDGVLDYFEKNNITSEKFQLYANRFGFGGIFHQFDLPLGVAQAFFDEGFTNVDIEVNNITPLMCLWAWVHYCIYGNINIERSMSVLDFLVQKGARLDREIPPRYIQGLSLVGTGTLSRYRVIHRVASLPWYNSLDRWHIEDNSWDTYSNFPWLKTWENLLASRDSDPCICACSSGGCRPISLALKSALGVCVFSGHKLQKPFFDLRDWESIRLRLGRLATLLHDITEVDLASDVLRFLTFSALELTHTCCVHNQEFWRKIYRLEDDLESHSDDWSTDEGLAFMIYLMDPAEVDEIREEEAPIFERLDSLVEGFVEEMQDLAIPLPEYIQTWWPERIYAELSAKDEIREKEQKELFDLGIRIVEADDESETDEVAVESWEEREERLRRERIRDYDEWIRGLETSIK